MPISGATFLYLLGLEGWLISQEQKLCNYFVFFLFLSFSDEWKRNHKKSKQNYSWLCFRRGRTTSVFFSRSSFFVPNFLSIITEVSTFCIHKSRWLFFCRNDSTQNTKRRSKKHIRWRQSYWCGKGKNNKLQKNSLSSRKYEKNYLCVAFVLRWRTKRLCFFIKWSWPYSTSWRRSCGLFNPCCHKIKLVKFSLLLKTFVGNLCK